MTALLEYIVTVLLEYLGMLFMNYYVIVQVNDSDHYRIRHQILPHRRSGHTCTLHACDFSINALSCMQR